MPDRSAESDPERDLVSAVREDASEVASLVGHFYRGEVDRMTTWRARLDQTTNWAVVVVAAILTWAFSSQDNPHYVLLIGVAATVAFLLIEAHRFREYDIWRSRVRVLQRNVFAGVLTGDVPDDDWHVTLGESLDRPTPAVPFWRAVGHRLRRVDLALLVVLLAAWVARVTVFEPDEPWRQTAAVPGLGGEVVVLAVAGVYALLVALAAWTGRKMEMREART